MINGASIEIAKSDGTKENVNLVTYLFSVDGIRKYIVYTKNETQGDNKDHIIYLSKLENENNVLKLNDISNEEWVEVQHLLKKIANAE